MDQFKRIIFVCTENTCRSIMAEAILNSVVGDRDLEVLSRGLVVLFPEPMNPKAVAVLKSNGLEASRAHSLPLRKKDITDDTLILAMTEQEAIRVVEEFGDGLKVTTLLAFLGQQGDIQEPYGALTDYGLFYERMDLLVKMIAEELFKEEEE